LVRNIKANQDEALVNMVLAINNERKVPKNMAFKDKEPLKTKSIIKYWAEENNFEFFLNLRQFKTQSLFNSTSIKS
jgi:hypothetical protein